jgi:hypothetical protein
MSDGPPLVVAVMPIVEEDPLRPSRLLWVAKDSMGGWTRRLRDAKVFEVKREAKRKAAKLKHYSPNVYAEVVSLPLAWAIENAARAHWKRNLREGQAEAAEADGGATDA